MKEILCFGDSNTYGLVPNEKRRFAYEERWTGILATLLGKDFHVTEEGLCGRTTVFEDFLRDGRRGTKSLPIILESHSDVDLVVLMLGTNDMKTCYSTNENVIALGVEKLIEQIQSFNKETKILLLSPIYLGEKVWMKEYDPEFSKNSVEISKKLKYTYKAVAEKHNIAFLAASDFVHPSEADQEHLDKENHAVLANAVFQVLQSIF